MVTLALCSVGGTNLVEREIAAALGRIAHIKLVSLVVDPIATDRQAHHLCDALRKQQCAALLTINDWGLDPGGLIARFCADNRLRHINWYVDTPAYLSAFFGIEFPPTRQRIDFISDRGLLDMMRSRGYDAHFLPLGTDPAIFFPLPDEPRTFARDVCFVGNSYREEMEKMLHDSGNFFETHMPFISEMLHRYQRNMRRDFTGEIQAYIAEIKLPGHIAPAKAAFIIRYALGYLHRKRIIASVARTFPGFTVFGDPFWLVDLPGEKVGLDVKYYTNLSQTYQQSRINLDINRSMIVDGFTQRIFDCLATGSFLITSPKPVIDEYFVSEGPEREIVVFENEPHLIELITYYLKHEDERAEIARRGHEKVMAHHTYDHRVKEMVAKALGEECCKE
jgi:spore maturation protein CgeB